MRRLALVLLLALAAPLATTGCMNVEQTLTLQKDLGGTAAVAMTIDMDSFVTMMARMQHTMSGGQGEPPAEMLESARREMLAEMKDDPVDFDEVKKSVTSSLPAGVKLLDASFKTQELKMVGNFVMGFDKLTRLNEIQLATPEAAADLPVGNPMSKPFESMKVTEDATSILIEGATTNPLAGMGKSPDGDMPAEMRAMMAPMFKGFRVATKITAPFEVLEHNATRREGTTLIWEYDFSAIEKVLAGEPLPAVRVKYKK